MSDLSSLSDQELQALYEKGAGISIHTPGDLSQMSDADLMKAYGQAAPVGIGEDAVKSIGAGLGSATIGTLGLPGDAANLLARGSQGVSNYISSKLGIDPGPQMGSGHILPTSGDIASTVTNPIVSPNYQPQYESGSLLKKAAEFAPNIMGGPESLGLKLATRVAAPAVASEAGGAVAGPIGEIAGALGGGALASSAANKFRALAAARAATPTLADTKSAATNVYDRLTSGNANTPIPQSELDTVAADLRTKLNAAGVRPSNAKGIHDALDELQNPATVGAPDVHDLVAARESIKNQLGSPDASKKGAFIALPKIEAAIERLSPGTMKDLKEADKNYSSFKASEALDKKAASADLRAAAVDSGMNVGNKIRQKVASYLESNDAKYLSAETKADLEKVVRGTWTQNGMRHVSNLLGGGGGLGMMVGAGAGYEAGGVEGAIAAGLAGRAFKMANNRSIMNQAAQVSRNIRMRSPLGQQTPLAIPPMSSPLLAGAIPALLARPKY